MINTLSLSTILFFLVVLSFVSVAQIPNADFEQWTLGEPDGWKTSNEQGVITPVTQSSTSHSGSFALRGEVVLAFHPPIVQSGPQGKGFAVSQRYLVVTGFYQFSPVGRDQFVVNVIMFRNGNGIAAGGIATSNVASSYTPFTVDLNYLSNEIPDTCVIKITIIGPMTGSDCHPGSTMLVDDLSFSEIVSVPENKNVQSKFPEWFQLYQNYPNPFNPKTNIEYALPEQTHVILTIYNLLSERITTLVNQNQDAGFYKYIWNAKDQPSGMYLYKLEADNFFQIKKMILLR